MTNYDQTPLYVIGVAVLLPLQIHSMVQLYRKMGGFRNGSEH